MTHQKTPGGPLSPYAISLTRTVVPLAWGYAVSWLIGLGLPASLLSSAHDVIVGGLTTLVTAAWYAGWRWAEVKVPSLDSWAARLVVVFALGHPAAPRYGTPAVVESPVSPAVPPSG